MNRRIAVNLAFFALLGAALAVWAVSNVVSFDRLDKPYRVTASFETSPGLSPDFEVTYLGHKVGAIDSVRLRPGHVDVVLKIERDVTLPKAVSAAVRRKSAVGEPYVDLARLPDAPPGGERLAEGDRIPIERTTTPLSYTDLFEAVDAVVSKIDPGDLRTVLHELATGLEGRGDSLRRLIEGTDQITRDLTDKSDLLDATIGDLTRLVHTFADHTGSIGSSIDNLSALAASFRQSRQTLIDLLERGPDFADRVGDVLSKTESDFGCLLDAFGGIGAKIAEPGVSAAIEEALRNGKDMLFVLKDIRDKQPDGLYNRGYLKFNTAPAPFYDKPLSPPAAPPLPTCAGVPGTGVTSPLASIARPGPALPPTLAAEAGPAAAPGPPPAAPPESSSTKPIPREKLRWLPLAGLLAGLSLVLAARPWRLVPLLRRGRGG